MRRIAVFGVLACVVGLTAMAQTQSPQQPAPQPVFRAGVDIVELDVSVLDKDRRPVHGLTKSDFTILEDRKPQPIVAFAAVDLPGPAPATAKWMADAPIDVDGNQVDDRRLVVIVIDDALVAYETNVDMGKLKMTRDSALRVISSLGPEDLAAVVFTRDNFSGQSFTKDPARLRAAVDRLVAGPGPPPEPAPGREGVFSPLVSGGPYRDCSQYWNSADALKNVIDTLALVPHRRKLVVDVSVGLKFDIWGVRDDPNPCTGKTRSEVAMLLETAEENNVNIYGVDPSGLKVGADIEDRQLLFLGNISANTGGRAIINTNAPAAQMPGVLAENGSYYLLGYSSANAKSRESLKFVEVKVDRPGVDVHSRSIYAAPPADSKLNAKPPPTNAAIADLVPKADLPLEATAMPFAGATGSGGTVIVAIALREPAPTSSTTDDIDLTGVAFTVDGRPTGNFHQVTAVTLSPSDGASAQQAEVFAKLSLAPGRYSLRLDARSHASGKEGSVYTDVTVPDFAKEAVSLSGLVFSATPGPHAAPREILARVVPVIPTTDRIFDRSQSVSAFVRVYQSAGALIDEANLRVRVLDDHDHVVVDRPSVIPAAAFATTRSADYRYTLPVSSWHPGACLFEVTATVGKHAATRAVRIELR